MGAGILPTALYKNKLYFLFGKENMYADTPGWSDFGGGTDNSERCLQTAIREGTEELTGFLGSTNDIRTLLSRGKYEISNEGDNDMRYTMFLVMTNYDPMLPFYYNNNQRFLQRKLDPSVIQKTKIFEKAEIRWVCIDDLSKMRPQFRHYFRKIVDRILNDKSAIYTFAKRSLAKKGFTKRKSTKRRRTLRQKH